MTDNTQGEPVTVHICQGEADAQLVRSFLESHSIRCIFWGEALRHVHGLTMDGLGKVEIRVAPEDEQRARELLERAADGEFAIDDVENAEDP